MKNGNLYAAMATAALCLGAHSAGATILLAEDFNDVRRGGGSCTQAMAADTTRNVSNILGNANCLAQLPAGTTASSGDSVNVRRGDNLINTTAGNTGFDSFFSASTANNFLVLGDNSDVIGGPLEQGTRFVMLPFTLPSGANDITIYFDWAFDGADTDTGANIADLATAAIVGNTTLLLLSLTSDSDLGTSGSFSQTILASGLPSGSLSLRFQLAEHNDNATNTAFGIDNVRVVPEPATVALLGLGLIGLGLTRRGKA
jgi:hypothetical protein